MSDKPTSKWILIVAVGLVVVGTAVLVISSLRESSVYFLNISEAVAMGTDKLENARLFGTVDDNNLQRDPKALGVNFRLMDKDDPKHGITVEYKGVVPDTFKPGAEVIVEGSINTSSNMFEATTLMTKCPSKYKKMREEEKNNS